MKSNFAEPILFANMPVINIDSILKKVEFIPIMINGDKNNRINIVIMNRRTAKDKAPYNSPEMKKVF